MSDAGVSDPTPGRSDHSSLCYILFCFSSQEYVSFLLASLYRSDDLFLIHCDRNAPAELKAYLSDISGVHDNIVLMTAQDYSWAGYSHVAACLRGMRRALSITSNWSHLIFLSEQHLPLKSPAAIAGALEGRKTVVWLRNAQELTEQEQCDVRSRFEATYRELPGVGCFAVATRDRQPDFYRSIHLGSSWFALHRSHCVLLLEQERQGAFEPFKQTVHAEEMAMQSILAANGAEIERRDVTLVAAPSLVEGENYSLVMTEKLYRNSIESHFLFVRKRSEILTPVVDEFIRKNHFVESLYFKPQTVQHEATTGVDVVKQLIEALSVELRKICDGNPVILVFDRAKISLCPKLLIAIRTDEMDDDVSVYVFSENLRDFKVSVIRNAPLKERWQSPFVSDHYVVSRLRANVADMLGWQDITPRYLNDQGFASIDENGSTRSIAFVVQRFLRIGGSLRNPRSAAASVPQDSGHRATRPGFWRSVLSGDRRSSRRERP